MLTRIAPALLFSLLAFGCSADDSKNASTATAPATEAPAAPAAAPIAAPAELVILDLAPGAGDAVAAGQVANMHYTGWLFDTAAPENKGTKFDSSLDRGEPFPFLLGGGQVIAGWDQGVAGMKVGGKRRLVIPAHLGYGDQGAGGVIPPGATLVFDVELVSIGAPTG